MLFLIRRHLHKNSFILGLSGHLEIRFSTTCYLRILWDVWFWLGGMLGQVKKMALLLLVQVVAVPQLAAREGRVIRRLLCVGPLVRGRYWSRMIPVVCNRKGKSYIYINYFPLTYLGPLF
jgi:hypothetical protein